MGWDQGLREWVREVHRTWPRELLGPGLIKVRTLSFSEIKPKITSV